MRGILHEYRRRTCLQDLDRANKRDDGAESPCEKHPSWMAQNETGRFNGKGCKDKNIKATYLRLEKLEKKIQIIEKLGELDCEKGRSLEGEIRVC